MTLLPRVRVTLEGETTRLGPSGGGGVREERSGLEVLQRTESVRSACPVPMELVAEQETLEPCWSLVTE